MTMKLLLTLLCILILLSRKCHAYYSSPYYYREHFQRPIWRQYTAWYPKAAGYFANSSSGVCNGTLQDYNEAFSAPSSSSASHYLLAICYQHESCLLDHVSSNSLMNFQSASVILGLMPTLLSMIGPGVSEIGLLSAHRPLLSFLVSMGAPAVWPTRIFLYEDSTHALKLDINNELDRLLMKRMGPRRMAIMSVAQYVLALAAIVNVITNSIEIGQKTILSWGCTTQFGPLLWAILPCIVHATAALGYFLTRTGDVNNTYQSSDTATSPSRQVSQSQNAKASATATTTTTKNSQKTGSRALRPSLMMNIRHRVCQTLLHETTVCANQNCKCLSEKRHVSVLATLLNFAAGCFGYIHLIFGIVIFSSLQLITVWDALNHVLWRYVASTLACRLILIIELGGIRRHKRETYI